MRNIYKISIALVLLLTMGCHKEYLDPVPSTSLSNLTVFDTKDRVLAQVNGMYDAMKTAQYLGGRYFVYNDIRCDNFIPKSSNLVTGYSTWNHTVIGGTNEVQNLWAAAYNAINVINIFLDGLNKAWDEGTLDGIITQSDYDQYKSESYTLRAIAYFHLLQLYAKPYNMGSGANPGLPLRLIAETSSENSDLARSTVAEVYAQILKDLNDAEPLAITDYDDPLLNTTRVHLNTIIAFKTRVYLHMGNWASVVSESAKIVSASAPYTSSTGVPFSLIPSYTNLWVDPYISPESIFSMPHAPTDNPGSQNSLPSYYFSGATESYYLNLAPGTAYAAMDATDVRKTSLTKVGDNYFISKFTDYTTHSNYSPVIRYAEVLLNRSEALVRQGSAVTQEAVDLLNAVRTRSFPTGAYTVASFPTVDDFYTAMLMERNIEFLGEGIRNMDLMRLGLTIPGKDGGSMGNISSVAPTSKTYIWPISDMELTFNKLMTGNDN
jgi:starch-binding outer membrane protein, SusD/RagB family